ncbi:MAG: hypothetical protein KGD68_00120 [Candidatus Lokiarchaeota archaeon]|nr:hypothetical protein [Candidatus Lokiarchaeota archaeon]
MAQAAEKKTICKKHLKCDLPALTQNLAPEGIQSQVLVLTTEGERVESSLRTNKLLREFNKIRYNARISEEKVLISKYKWQVDAKLLGVRNSMLIF